MRAYHIALFIFLVNFSFATVDQITDQNGDPIFFGMGSYEKIKTSDYNRDTIEDIAGDLRGSEESGGANIFDAVKFIFQGFVKFVDILIMSTVGVPLILKAEPFNFPEFFCNALLAGIVIVYLTAIIQFFTGRRVED